MNNLDVIRAFLIRAVLLTYIQLGTTSKLQQMKSNINDNDYEITVDMLEQMNDLRVTDGKIDDIINSEKGSRVAGEELYFLGVNWIINTLSSNWTTCIRMIENKLLNLQLLKGRSNGSKNAMRLVDYYNDMNEVQKAEFCKEALIPVGFSLELGILRNSTKNAKHC